MSKAYFIIHGTEKHGTLAGKHASVGHLTNKIRKDAVMQEAQAANFAWLRVTHVERISDPDFLASVGIAR